MTTQERAKGLDKGKLWSFFRKLLSQGGDIQLDCPKLYPSYEHYSARLDEAARERADEFLPLLTTALDDERRRVWEEAAKHIGSRVEYYKNTREVDPFTRAIQINEAEGCIALCRQQATPKEAPHG